MSAALDQLVAELAAHVPREARLAGVREAAVAMLLTGDPDRLLLIRRAERAGDPWSGHLAFPGGRREAADGDLLDTAIRETREETGVRLDRGDCVAILDDLAPVSRLLPAIVVRPYVFHLPEGVVPGLSDEVAHAAWIPLARLAGVGVYQRTARDLPGGAKEVEGYALEEGFLWGMTERMVTPVLRRWQALSRDGA